MKSQKSNLQRQQIRPVGVITVTDPTSIAAEQYRTLRTNIQFASAADHKTKTIVITSSNVNEGKSTVAANLAVVFAQAGQNTLLVDADMRKSTVHRSFALANNKGISSLLSSPLDTSECIQQTDIPNLSILTSGPKPPNPSELLGSKRMNQVINELEQQFDIILFDMPPITIVTDAQLMAARVDGSILIAREDVTQKETLLQAEKMLKMVGANILGVVYNGAKNETNKDYYYYGEK